MTTQRITASGRRFLVIDGIRRWLDQPPAQVLPDLLPALSPVPSRNNR